MRGRDERTDFWNFSRNSWACSFSDRETFPDIVVTAARTALKDCPAVPSLLAILDEEWGCFGIVRVGNGRRGVQPGREAQHLCSAIMNSH